ncbi:MAG: hypothetical protein HLUCCX14_07475 [Marinobacter excellens HL-55]|uniref:Uncharacterized protein n=1 Tax=Marinobacter excellens HL-55 TaxID=1305731 RepID=A0A0P7Z434_9GAMM|nr:MAG: hypothetical protein HLUCCX14_07475 [Marinobacter excellens HL-55]
MELVRIALVSWYFNKVWCCIFEYIMGFSSGLNNKL